MLDLVGAGRKVAEVAEELGIIDQTIDKLASSGSGPAGSGDASYDTRTKGYEPPH